jgi:hypothetical protein
MVAPADMLLGAAFIARWIFALSDSSDANAFVVETHNVNSEASNSLVVVMIESPLNQPRLELTSTALGAGPVDNSAFLVALTELL